MLKRYCKFYRNTNLIIEIMQGKFKIITLCGSTKFKEPFMTEQKRLTLEGNIIISVGCFGHRSEERRVGKECRSRWSPYH